MPNVLAETLPAFRNTPVLLAKGNFGMLRVWRARGAAARYSRHIPILRQPGWGRPTEGMPAAVTARCGTW